MSALARRVVMLSPSFYPHVGGAEKQALELSRLLAARGVPVTVLTRRKRGLARAQKIGDVSVERLAAWGGGLLNSLVFMASSFAWLASNAGLYDVIHVHLAGSPALSACLAARLFKKRVVVKIGGGRGIGEIAVSRGTWPGRFKLWLLGRFRPQFVAVTRDLAAELQEAGLGAGVRVIPNGVDVARYHPVSPEDKALLRGKLGWSPGMTFIYVGRFSPEKQLGFFLKAFSAVAREIGGEASLFLVGTGAEELILKDEIERLGLGARARVLPPADDVTHYYAAADVFILPSTSEGLSNALLEAMSAGLAVLAGRVGGTPDAAPEGECSLLFNPYDEDELRAQIRKFLKSPDLAARLGAAARKAAAAEFSLDKVAERYLELYRDI